MNRRSGVLLSLVYTGIEVVVTFFLTPYMIASLGDAEYGVFKLCESVTTYLLLLDLGVGQAAVRYIAKYRTQNDKDTVSKTLGLVTLFFAGIGAVTLIVGTGLVFFSPVLFGVGLTAEEIALMKVLLVITTVNTAIVLGSTGFSNTIIAYERFRFQKGVMILQLILRGVLIWLLLRNGMGSLGIVLAQLGLTVISRLLMVLYVICVLKILPAFGKIDRKLAKEVLSFSGWIFILMLATQMNRYMDQILLGAFVVAASRLVAVYSTGLQIEYYYEHLGYAMNNVLMPGVVRMVEEKASAEELCGEMIRIGRYVFSVIAFGWVSFVVCGQKFIVLWVGEEYKEAYLVAVLLMTVSMFTMTQVVGDNMLSALNELKEWAVLNVCVIVLNFVISVILLRYDPITGVLIGTFFSMLFCGVVVKNYLYVKKIHIDLRRYYKGLLERIWICVLLTLGAGIALRFLLQPEGWAQLVVDVAVMGCFYGMIMWLYGFKKSEKRYIRALLWKRSGR